jgi:hypothetical protein
MARGLYTAPRPQIRDFLGNAQQSLQAAGNLYGRMDKEQKFNKPDKTIGGGIQSAAGAGVTGYMLGGPAGAGIGSAIGLVSYYLS